MLKKVNTYKRHDGGALVVVIMIMFVVMILGTIILQISLAETRFSVRDKNRIEAYYLAKSGVEATADWLNDPANNPSLILNQTSTQRSLPGSNGLFSVEVIDDSANALLILKGTGIVNGVSSTATMTMHRIVDESAAFGFDYLIYAGDSLTVSGNVEVDEDQLVGVGEPLNESFTKNGAAGEFPSVANGTLVYDNTKNYPQPVYPSPTASLGNLVVSGSQTIDFTTPGAETITYNSIALNNNSTLTIKTGAGSDEVNLVTGTLDLKGTGSRIVIVGEQRLNLFFSGNVEVRSMINPGPPLEPEKLIFFMSGTGNFNIKNNGSDFQFNAFIYAPGASLTTNGNSNMTGAVIFDSVSLGGNPYLEGYEYDGGTDSPTINFESYYVGGSWIE